MTWTAGIINNGLINDSGFMSAANAILDGSSCVVGINDLLVTPGTGLQVQIAPGTALIYSGSKASYIPVNNSSTVNQAITSNSSGSTRIDLICVKLDTTITSDSAMDNVATPQYVTGTAGAGVPATPAGYYKIAEITVTNGAASISSGNIADKRTNMVSLISMLNAVKQASTPSNPASGMIKAYFKSDGNLYSLNSAGVETQIGATTGSVVNSGSISGSTTSATMVAATGTVAITTTKTMNIRIFASIQVYANPGSAWGEEIFAQITNGGTGTGSTPRQDLTSGNPRFQVNIETILTAQPAGTYTFGLQFRTQNGNTVTIEQGYIDVVAYI